MNIFKNHTPASNKILNLPTTSFYLKRLLRLHKLYLSICILLVATMPAISQVNLGNMGFEYSLLVKDTAGHAKSNAPVTLAVYLLPSQTSAVANAVWAENQNATTDAYGFANIVIGTGTKSGGTAASFNAINFSTTTGAYWVLIQLYNPTTNTYQTFIKDALAAVPYAKVAASLSTAPSLPPGVVAPFAGDVNQVPAGWLLCDGRELDNTNPLYQPLFNAISFNWGTSDNNTKFDIPNLADIFLKGATDIAIQGSYPAPTAARVASAPGGNTGPNVGSYEKDAFFAHQHTTVAFFNEGNNTAVFSYSQGYVAPAQLQTQLLHKSDIGVGPALNAAGNPKASAYETRPVNVAVNYIIKL